VIAFGLLWFALAAEPRLVSLPAERFAKIDADSGKDNYYQVVVEGAASRIAADYQPPMDTETFGAEIPDPLRKRVERLHWRWRVRAFPRGGDDCVHGIGDSAAAVFLTFHSGFKWILIKYIWSERRPAGSVCDQRDSLFLQRDTVVLESGDAFGMWREAVVDPKTEYVKHFGGKREDVPDFVGIGLFTDGDQTKSSSAADYADFILELDGLDQTPQAEAR
jgi:hypothetical protein